MHEGVTLALIIASVILIGFLGDHLFKRTGIPDMLFLVTLGIILGPILVVLDSGLIRVLAPYIASISLVIILFDGGLKMRIYEVFSESPRAVLLATLGFMFATITVALFMYYAHACMSFVWNYIWGRRQCSGCTVPCLKNGYQRQI